MARTLRASQVPRRGWLVACVLVVLASCGDSRSSFPLASATVIALDRLPPRPECELQLISFESLTFHISAGAPVTAVADATNVLVTAWDVRFRGVDAGSGGMVVDEKGAVVVRDGQVVPLPENDWPRIGGYLMCINFERIWVFHDDPQ